MRQIILDTETTGLNPQTGDRLVELGCVELLNRRLTGNNKHYYINPERDSDEGALKVHGLTREFLSDKPTFDKIASDFLDYLRGADEVIIHNAPFDVGFLDAELNRTGHGAFKKHATKVVDSLAMAKHQFPGKRHSLDALCSHFGVDNSGRKLHGALLDAELLADVYICLTRGQETLGMDLGAGDAQANVAVIKVDLSGFSLPVLAATGDELAAHEKLLSSIDKASGGKTVYKQTITPPDLRELSP